jgi:hypothetical protein
MTMVVSGQHMLASCFAVSLNQASSSSELTQGEAAALFRG